MALLDLINEKPKKADEQRIYQAHPRLYRRALAPEGERGCMAWGLSIGDGWMPLMAGLSAEIERILIAHKVPEGLWPAFEQVKEKFGELRIYLSWPEEMQGAEARELPVRREIRQAANTAVELSRTICEKCGAPGKLIQEGW